MLFFNPFTPEFFRSTHLSLNLDMSIFIAPALVGRLRRTSFRPFVRPSVRSFVRSPIRQHLPWASCECNSSYSFVPIVLKLLMCFLYTMRACIWLGYNCYIIFVTFPHCELSHFSPSIYRQWVPLVSATPLTVLYRLF